MTPAAMSSNFEEDMINPTATASNEFGYRWSFEYNYMQEQVGSPKDKWDTTQGRDE
jgi:hypothetical protein